MGVKRRHVLVGFFFSLFFGIAVYFRLWSIDSTFSSDDREFLKKQFDRANMEAMDESAEWRMKYDEEAERGRQCQEELVKGKGALASANKRLAVLQKEIIGLQKQMALTHKFETKEQICNCNQSSTQLR